VKRQAALLPILVLLATTESWSGAARGASGSPVLHEQIPIDARDDLALGTVVDGELPAALDTPSGLVRAPDPRKLPGSSDPPYDASGRPQVAPNGTYEPDRNTGRPDLLPYDEPFTPSTAPFKRLSAFDAVDANYKLYVQSQRLDKLPASAPLASDGSEEQFFADLVVDVRPGVHVRIPSVGPGARVVKAHLAVGTKDVPFRLWHDGADNWFVEGQERAKARLVMELTIPRATFGGEFGSPRWSDLAAVAPLPPHAAAAAQKVLAHIGVSRSKPPREAVKLLVEYFRSFADSEEHPKTSDDIYLDLALSQKGVCRHRAFAFLVTALGLGLPARMVINEAHAWVEVNDARLWRRIDLGGAGRTLGEQNAPPKVQHAPPADPFAWPSGATRGEDMANRSRGGGPGSGNGGNGAGNPNGAGTVPVPPRPTPSGSGSAGNGTSPFASSSVTSPASSSAGTTNLNEKDDRPLSLLTLVVADGDARRGGALRVSGGVKADGDSCANVVVEIALRSVTGRGARTDLRVGSVATDAKGTYVGALVVPSNVPVGDYEVVASTAGDMRCGRSK
jgi:transglutaminase-like putative cysteine protease